MIYAKALYKPRIPETTSLEILIKDDQDEFRKHDPSMVITRVPPLKTKDGKALESYTFFQKNQRQWGAGFVRRGRRLLLNIHDQFEKPCGIYEHASSLRAVYSSIQRVIFEVR